MCERPDPASRSLAGCRIPLVLASLYWWAGFCPLGLFKETVFIVPGLLLGLGGLGTFLIDSTLGIYVSIVLLGIGSWSYAATLLSLPMELPDMTPEKVAVVWGTFVTVSGICMFISPIVVGAIRDGTGTFVPGFIIFAVVAWFLMIAGLLIPTKNWRSATGNLA